MACNCSDSTLAQPVPLLRTPSSCSESTVTRRFSDFLGLHDKLSDKYLQNGRVIPPAPDKSVVNMTKVIMINKKKFTQFS